MARRGAGAWGCGRVLGVGLGGMEGKGGCLMRVREVVRWRVDVGLLSIVAKMM